MARCSQETPQSGMNLFLGTVLLLLLLPDVAEGQDSCSVPARGDDHRECCNTTVEQQNPENILRLPQRCPELWRSASRACACLRERSFRLLQSGQHRLLAGLKRLLLTVSRAVTDDILIAFSPTEGPSRLKTTEKGKAGKIHLPREIFQSLINKTVHVVVTVLNIQQLGMFKEFNQTAQVLDNTVVGITVGESSISGLQEPVQLTFAHRELPRGVTPQCVFWDPSKDPSFGCLHSKSFDGCCHRWLWGSHGFLHLHHGLLHLHKVGWASSSTGACQAGRNVEQCQCLCMDLLWYSTRPCSPVTPALPGPCGTLRCRFRFEETVRINLGLHMNLMGSLILLNLAFLLNSGLSGRAHPSTCRVLGGFTHYCLLCCFTWTALEGCQLYLLFVKVLGIYIHRYLAKLCLVGWGFPVLVVGVAGIIGSYGEYNIRTMDHQVIANLCWITSKHILVHYITNCGYFGLIFLFNMAIFGVVTHKSCSLQGTGAVQGYQKPWKVALVSVGLFCLLGATWALVFLTYGISSTAMLYLFTILNSFQGIFIFIWLVVLYYPKTRETTGSLSYIIRHEKTTTASQD
ncbi:adhesion G protein-coupled receptor G3-like isoform 1-T1 [Acridotheres tristis]